MRDHSRAARLRPSLARVQTPCAVCLICMPYMYALYGQASPESKLRADMYVLHVCLICMSYMYALYVCLICMPYMCASHARLICVYTCREAREEKDYRAWIWTPNTANAYGAFISLAMHEGMPYMYVLYVCLICMKHRECVRRVYGAFISLAMHEGTLLHIRHTYKAYI